MNELPSVAVVLAALVSGIILGLSTGTNFEYEFRGTSEPLFTIFRAKSAFGVAAIEILWLLIIAVAIAAASVLIIGIGGAYPLSKIDRYAFVIVWFLSAACAKYLRFRYWKKKSEKL